MRFVSAVVMVSVLLTVSGTSKAQVQNDYGSDYGEYGDYGGDYGDQGGYADDGGGYGAEQDSLYHDYAERQQAKNLGGAGGGMGLGKIVLTGALSWMLGGKFHAGRLHKKLKTRHQKEQKKVYSQYYNDVYKLSEQNSDLAVRAQELQDLLKQTEAAAEMEALQRDYDEFKQPDIDGDDRISRAEFNMYVKNYLSNYPGLSEKDYPKFDDFDHDGDGHISFQEYAQQMALQAQQAELEQMYSTNTQDKQKAQALQDMYNSASGGGGGLPGGRY